MAEGFRDGSDIVLDYCCYVCDQNEVQQDAVHYCEQCSKYYCDQCLPLHNQMFKKHSLVERGEKHRWPVAKATVDVLTQCKEHINEKITLFCEDHNKLCCIKCVTKDHRQCSSVELISDLVTDPVTDARQNITEDIAIMIQQLQNLQSDREYNIQTLQLAYENIWTELKTVKQTINDALDKLEKNTLNNLDLLRTKMLQSIQCDIAKCTKQTAEMKSMNGIMQDIGNKDDRLCFIANKECAEKLCVARALLKDMCKVNTYSMKLDIHQDVMCYLSTLAGLGEVARCDPNKAMCVSGKAHCSANIENEIECSSIRGICETEGDNIVAVDVSNMRIKVLDKDNNVICHSDLATRAYDMCQISLEEVAVTVDDGNTHCVQFYEITKGTISNTKNLFLAHRCRGITNHMNVLYITSGTALRQYTQTGKLLNKLYEDTSGEFTVYKTAIGRGKIYITNSSHHKLITLGMDGTPLATFTGIQSATDVHVTVLGQVLVCGVGSNMIVQVTEDGQKKLATIATESNGMNKPWCLLYNVTKNTLFVGHGSGLVLLNIS